MDSTALPKVTITTATVNPHATMTVGEPVNLPENVVTLTQLGEAARAYFPGRGREGIPIEEIIAKMTGLDMSRYVVEGIPNECAWRIVRREDVDG